MSTTTKTLTPTNQTITLPDMTERPNASVLVDGIGKDADAINALSDQKANYINLTSSETVATAYAKLNALSNLDVANIFIDSAVMSNLTGGVITTSANGLVVKGNNSTYRYNLMVGASAKTIIFTINGASATSWGTMGYFHDLYDQIGDNFRYVDLGQVPANSSKNFTVSNSSRVLVMTFSNAVSRISMQMVSASGSGALFMASCATGSDVSYSTSTNTLTITNNSSTAFSVYALVIGGSISA